MNSAGSWVDDVMAPLAGRLSGAAYNRIYEAVERGTRAQGERLVRDLKAALAAAAEREEKLVGVLMSARKVAGRAYGRACADGCDSDSAHDVSMEALSEHVDAALSPTPTEPQK